MTAFIRQEALEKAREIEIKADEEFAIEKSKLVRQETSAIDSTYAKKTKQASMSQQITRSTLANKTRIKVLSARQEVLDDLFEKTRNKLADSTKDKGKYQEMCKGLILEGLYALNESKVAVRAKKADWDTVKKAIEPAKKEYKEKLHKDVEIVLDEKNPLPNDSCVPPSPFPLYFFRSYYLPKKRKTKLIFLSIFQSRRPFNHRRRRQDRHQQHPRRTPEIVRNRRPAHCEDDTVWEK